MKWWLVAFGAFLFVSLFTPFVDYRIYMFWDLFGSNAKAASWCILNALLGVAVSVNALVLHKGIARGSVMAGVGLASFILYTSLYPGRFGAAPVFFDLGLLAMAVMLSACALRQRGAEGLFVRLLGGISGSLSSAFLLVALLVRLVNTENHWLPIVGSILISLFSLVGIVAGILAAVLIGKRVSTGKLLKAVRTLVIVFLSCITGWMVTLPIWAGLAFSQSAGTVLVGVLGYLLTAGCVLIYFFLLCLGIFELIREVPGLGHSENRAVDE